MRHHPIAERRIDDELSAVRVISGRARGSELA